MLHRGFSDVSALRRHRSIATSGPKFVFIWLASLLCTTSTLAQPATTDSAMPVPPPTPAIDAVSPPTFAIANREELAVAYRRIDALLQRQLADGGEPANLAQINQRFDSATLKFFSGQFANVLKDLADLAGTMTPMQAPSDASGWLALRSLAVRFELDGPEPQVVFQSLFPLPQSIDTNLLVNFGSGPTGDFKSYPFRVEAGRSYELRIPLKAFVHPHMDRALAVQYSLPIAAQADHWESRPFILPSPEHQQMIDDIETRLAQDPPTSITALSIDIVRARVELLKQTRNPSNSAHFMGFTNRILAEIQGNLKLLHYGTSPFKNRDGLVYRPIIIEGNAIPNYIYAPPSAFGKGPVPLVVLLHGAGGDEAMFMAAYGNGEAKRQAETHGCIIASPSTTAVMSSPAVLDALIDQTCADFSIDRSRVFVVGHSMGAAAAAGLARTRAATLAGVVCLAGGRLSTKPLTDGATLAPILSIVASLDPLMGKVDVERVNAAVKQAHLPIEAREMKDWGHTLMVGPALPQAFEWMMACKPINYAQPAANESTKSR